MRLTRDDLHKITGFKTPNKQVWWFQKCLGIAVPHDRAGPILTPSTYEAILAKRLGVLPHPTAAPEREVVIHMHKPRQARAGA